MTAVKAASTELESICKRFEVERLEIFGSAATPAFDSMRSDLDFVVEFKPETDLGPWMSRYFDLQRELSRLYGRNVDLVMASAIRDPSFAREAARTRRPIYNGRKDKEVASRHR